MIWIEMPRDRKPYCNCCNLPKEGVRNVHISVKDNKNCSTVVSLCKECRKDLIRVLVDSM